MKWWKRAMRAVIKPEENSKLKMWQKKYEDAKQKYGNEISEMDTYEKYYMGDRRVKGNPNKTNDFAGKKSINVRNIVYELIER